MLSWSRYYNGLEYTYRQCKGEGCGIYTWLHGDRCSICETNNVKIVDNDKKEEEILHPTMMDDSFLDD